MRVAAIYDIHGNLPALEAVLEDVRQENVDHVVVGGDVVPGPMVRETLACLLALDVPVRFIQGNGEVAVVEAMAGRDHPAVPEQHRPIIRRTLRSSSHSTFSNSRRQLKCLSCLRESRCNDPRTTPPWTGLESRGALCDQ